MLLHTEVVERRRVGPVLVGGRSREPQRSPARAQAKKPLDVVEQGQGPGLERAADGKHVSNLKI